MAHNSGKSYAPELSRIVEYYPRRGPLDGTGDGSQRQTWTVNLRFIRPMR